MEEAASPKFVCAICGKQYGAKTSLARHQKTHDETQQLRCTDCNYKTTRQDNLLRHYKLFHGVQPPEAQRHPGSLKRYYPWHGSVELDGGAMVPAAKNPRGDENRQSADGGQMSEAASTGLAAVTEHLATTSADVVASVEPTAPAAVVDQQYLQQHQRQQQSATAPGLEEEEESSREEPTTEDAPALSTAGDLEPEDEEGDDDVAMNQLLEDNRRWIQTYSRITNRLQDKYNYELIGTDLRQMENYIDNIYTQAKSPYKLNAAFGFVLTDTTNNQHRYYYASKNNRMMAKPILVRTADDNAEFMREFEALDLLEYCRQQRPNTKFIVRLVTNVLFYVDKLPDFNVGAEIGELPDFIVRRKCIIGLNKDQHSAPYRDKYCLFRCYQYHQHWNAYPNAQDTYELVDSYCKGVNIPTANFPGVPISRLNQFEDHFQINVEVYQLIEEQTSSGGGSTSDDNTADKATKVRTRKRWSSRAKYDDTMNVNIHNNHFSYITQLNTFSDTWECHKCRKLFRHRGHLNVHVRSCNTTTKLVFIGGGFGLPKSVFDRMNECGIKVPEVDRFFPHMMSFDFEAMTIPITDERETKETLLAMQEPVSVSLCSNVPGYTEPKCFISEGDPHALVGKMYAYIQEVSMVSYDMLCERYQSVLNELEYYVNERKFLLERAGQLKEDGEEAEAEQFNKDAYVLKPYVSLSKQFDQWLSRIPVLGFNSGKYDWNLIRSFLFPVLLDNDVKVESIIKKNNDYLSILTDHAVFLDIKNFIAAGTSYSGWLKANGIENGKQFFPYSWLTSIDKLEQTHLPPIEEFFSELHQENIRQEDYDYLKEMWHRLGFRTMRDLLEWYNNADVVPFLEAAQKMVDLWRELGIDCYKNGMISLPGLALNYLTRAMQPHTILPLFDERNKDVYQTLRDNIVGGLSIVMHRYHEKGKTLLPNGQPCEYVCSLDANSLYLWALGQPTGTGVFALWRPIEASQPGTSLDWIPPSERNTITDARKRQHWEDTVVKNLTIEFRRTSAYPNSKSEVDWLEWVAFSTGRKIEHKFNGRPKTVNVTPDIHYRLDGYHPDTQTAYCFQGCLWHGHGCRLDTEKSSNMRDARRERTTKEVQTLKDMGYTVVEMWECQWRKVKSDNPQIHKFLEEHLNLKMRKTKLLAAEMVEAIQDEKIFGLLECDIEVPWFNDVLVQHFAEFPPICKNIQLDRSQIGDHMRVYAEEREYMKQPVRCMINSYWAHKILLSTPLLKWYLDNGLWITRIYQLIEMKPKACFANIMHTITEHRRRADDNPDYAPLGNAWKTVGNSLYGKTMTRKDKFKKTTLVKDEKAPGKINNAAFVKMEEVGGTAYEICLDKSKIEIDLPLSVASYVYNYAKLQMMDFIYNFMKRYLKEGSYQLVASDTDSIIAAYASENIDDLVKDELREEYFKYGKKKYLVTDAHSKREPGKMKNEGGGTGIIALCSKTYIMWSETDRKISTKGLSKRTNKFEPEDFWNVLNTKLKSSGTNYGFRVKKDKVFVYRQDREGLAYLYGKRQVQSDGVSTKPLPL